MKNFLSTALTLVCIVLVIALIAMKWSDNGQHGTDLASIADFSNRLDSAQLQIAFGQGTVLTLSNNLALSQSAALMFSNQLTEAESTLVLDDEQITNLTLQVAQTEAQNQALSQSVMDLTNQVAGLSKQIAETRTNLAQADSDYALLENRFRQNVAERLVMQRKFNNTLELQKQMEVLKENPAQETSLESIYTELNVEVNSNGTFHVISPD